MRGTIKVGMVDDRGNVVNDVFDTLPLELESQDLSDNGNFYVNAKAIDFGSPDRKVTVEKFIISKGPGFFGSSPTAEIGGGPVTLESNHNMVIDPGNLEVDKTLI